MVKRPLDRLSTLAPLGLCLALGLFAAGCGDVQPVVGTSPANPLDPEEDALVSALNTFRGTVGITAPVSVCKSLNASASAHADDMRDNGYLSDKAKDGSTPRTRGCAAGYKPGCGTSAAMAEVVASGFVNGKDTMPQWTMDMGSAAILGNKDLNIVGVGRSLNGDVPVWALDVASVDDPSCH